MIPTDRSDLSHNSHTSLSAAVSSHIAVETHGLSLRTIQAFLTLASVRSFTKAAKELKLTQSGLSRVIGSFEKAVGEPLFHRSNHLVRLTEVGAGLVPHARHLRHCYLQALNVAGQPCRTSVSLACACMLVSDLMPHLSHDDAGETRQDLRFRTMGSHMVVDAVRSGGVDLGVCIIGSVPDDLCVEVVYQAPIGLLARPDVPMPQRVDNLTDLSELTFARLTDDMVLPSHLRHMGIDLPGYFNAGVVSDSMTGLMSAVRSRSCVSLVSELAAHHTLASDLAFKPLPNLLPPMHLCIVRRRTIGARTSRPQPPGHLSLNAAEAQKALVTSARKAVHQLVDELQWGAAADSSQT